MDEGIRQQGAWGKPGSYVTHFWQDNWLKKPAKMSSSDSAIGSMNRKTWGEKQEDEYESAGKYPAT